jgi:hypothetical protein
MTYYGNLCHTMLMTDDKQDILYAIIGVSRIDQIYKIFPFPEFYEQNILDPSRNLKQP